MSRSRYVLKLLLYLIYVCHTHLMWWSYCVLGCFCIYLCRIVFCLVISGTNHSGMGLSQWETMLFCNVVSHWLSTYPGWSLNMYHVDRNLPLWHYPPAYARHVCNMILTSNTGNAWVINHCGYWCPGAKAPGHQYQQCWLCIHCNIHCNTFDTYIMLYLLRPTRKPKITFWKQGIGSDNGLA